MAEEVAPLVLALVHDSFHSDNLSVPVTIDPISWNLAFLSVSTRLYDLLRPDTQPTRSAPYCTYLPEYKLHRVRAHRGFDFSHTEQTGSKTRGHTRSVIRGLGLPDVSGQTQPITTRACPTDSSTHPNIPTDARVQHGPHDWLG